MAKEKRHLPDAAAAPNKGCDPPLRLPSEATAAMENNRAFLEDQVRRKSEIEDMKADAERLRKLQCAAEKRAQDAESSSRERRDQLTQSRKGIAIDFLRRDAATYSAFFGDSFRDRDVLLAALRSEKPLPAQTFWAWELRENDDYVDEHGPYGDYGGTHEEEQGIIPWSGWTGDSKVLMAYAALDDFSVYQNDNEDDDAGALPLSYHLTSNKEAMVAVLKKDARAYPLLADKLASDMDVIMAMLQSKKGTFDQLGKLPGSILSNHDVIRAILNHKDWGYMATEATMKKIEKKLVEMLEDRDFAFGLLAKQAWHVEPTRGESDDSHFRKKWNPYIWMDCLPKELCDDIDFMSKAVRHCGAFLSVASERLRGNRDLVELACKNNSSALEHCLSKDELASDKNFILSVIKSEGGKDIYYDASPAVREDREVAFAAVNSGLHCLKGSETMKCPAFFLEDKTLLCYAVSKCGYRVGTITDDMKYDADVFQAFLLWAGSPEHMCYLSRHTKKAMGVNPHLWHCQETLVRLAKAMRDGFDVCPLLDLESGRVDTLIRKNLPDGMKCNHAVMAELCSVSLDFLEIATEDTRNDRDLLLYALRNKAKKDTSSAFENIEQCIKYLSSEFLSKNFDVILDHMLQNWTDYASTSMYRLLWKLSARVWASEEFTAKFLSSSVNNPKEAIKMLSKYKPDAIPSVIARVPVAIKYVAPAMIDMEFLLSVIRMNGKVFALIRKQYRDFDLTLAAVAQNCAVVGHIWNEKKGYESDEFRQIVEFAEEVRKKLKTFNSFLLDFLCGVGITVQRVAPAKRCKLPTLDLGGEGGVVIKRSIAEYADVAIGVQLNELRKASDHLSLWGF